MENYRNCLCRASYNLICIHPPTCELFTTVLGNKTFLYAFQLCNTSFLKLESFTCMFQLRRLRFGIDSAWGERVRKKGKIAVTGLLHAACFHTQTTSVSHWIPHECTVVSHVRLFFLSPTHACLTPSLKLIAIVTLALIMWETTVTTKIYLSGGLLVMHWVLWMTHLSTIPISSPLDLGVFPYPESFKNRTKL